jgi:hypothetical protein
MEGSLVAYKVFTNGSVLQASELNENLMKQAVAVFSNAAARTAAISSPVEGQLTYLEDTNRYGMWNGTSWVSPLGLTLLGENNFTAASSVAVDNVFSSEFENYKIILNVDSNTSNGQLSFLFRTSAPADLATTTVSFVAYGGGTNVASYAPGGNQLGHPLAVDTKSGTGFDLTIYNPFQSAIRRSFTGQFHALSTVAGGQWVGGIVEGFHDSANVASGFRIAISAGTMTGSVRVYGMRNA